MLVDIKGVKPEEDYFDVLMEDDTTFKILRPNFSSEADMRRFTNELLGRGISLIQVGDFMLTLIVGLLFAPPDELYRRG